MDRNVRRNRSIPGVVHELRDVIGLVRTERDPPTPVVPTMDLPGLAFSHAISSLMSSFAGTDLAATMNCGPSEISAASVIEK